MTSPTMVDAPTRPEPGRRDPRTIWTGEGATTWVEPEFPSAPALHRGELPRKRQYVGLDVARGFALIGMFAVHILPAYNAEANRATLQWLLFAGTSSALFGVLAGAGLAFTTGGAFPYQGRRLVQSHVQIVLRSVILLAIGFAVNQAPLVTYNILVYFAITFVLAIPFTMMRIRHVGLVGIGFMVLLPFVRFWVHGQTKNMGYFPNPQLQDLLADPFGVLNTLAVSGVYPAFTWLAFITIGIGVGRLIVRWPGAPLFLFTFGGLAYAIIRPISIFVERSERGYAMISASFPGVSEDGVDDFIVFGPTGQFPTDSLGWIISGSPHGETPFALLMGATAAVATIGFFMLVTRHSPGILDPLATVGRIPATIYLSHLLLLAYVAVGLNPWKLFAVQLVLAFGFAYLWRVLFRQGPVEWGMSTFAKLARFIIPASRS